MCARACLSFSILDQSCLALRSKGKALRPSSQELRQSLLKNRPTTLGWAKSTLPEGTATQSESRGDAHWRLLPLPKEENPRGGTRQDSRGGSHRRPPTAQGKKARRKTTSAAQAHWQRAHWPKRDPKRDGEAELRRGERTLANSHCPTGKASSTLARSKKGGRQGKINSSGRPHWTSPTPTHPHLYLNHRNHEEI